MKRSLVNCGRAPVVHTVESSDNRFRYHESNSFPVFFRRSRNRLATLALLDGEECVANRFDRCDVCYGGQGRMTSRDIFPFEEHVECRGEFSLFSSTPSIICPT